MELYSKHGLIINMKWHKKKKRLKHKVVLYIGMKQTKVDKGTISFYNCLRT